MVIGGSGHVGSFLVPRLCWSAANLSRGARAPYVDDEVWSEVEVLPVHPAALGRGRTVRETGRRAQGRGGGGHDLLHARPRRTR